MSHYLCQHLRAGLLPTLHLHSFPLALLQAHWLIEPALPPNNRPDVHWNQHPWKQQLQTSHSGHRVSLPSAPVLHIGDLLGSTPLTGCLPFPLSLPMPLPVLPSATCIRICFQGTPIKVMTQQKSSKQQMPLPGSACFSSRPTKAET